MLPFHDVVADDFSEVNDLIIRQLYSDVGLVENIGHYLIEAGGKRLRPLMVLLCARALDYNGKHHLDLAAVIEFIHSATLLHDDVVDVSSLRRGRPTANAEWGNAPSVLVGDFLYSRAFQMMVAIGNMDIMTILSKTTNIIAEGEVQQLVNAKDPDLTEAGYRQVIEKKTAVLFAAACEVGAVIAGADATTRQTLSQYGLQVGIAFQLVDDALDYKGDAEALGKNVGDDLAEGKPTLPLIRAMEKAPDADRELIRNAISNGDASQLDKVVAIVEATGAMEYTLAAAREAVALALTALEALPESRYRSALADVAEFATGRNH
ncbi:polyprenyl synthetase family protein [uncultured Gilvimarinus sp.]|uniref:polyprenyl synthetase family protein n=1 Tax=uncultured Gilvimarinus sp. TaxID=1689143 RepID=UPI0030ED63EA|tara:strand:+ start:359 stop:1321 length:963 start_codon:yes stop_codon:yes gene_type:complete